MKEYKDIFEAIWDNNIKAVSTFLPEQLKLRGIEQRTPLHYVCRYGYIEIVRLLLNCRSDINAKDYYGRTPLYWACAYGYTEIAAMLLDNGADIEARDDDGWTPLHMVCYKGKLKLSELLVSRGADPTVLDNKGQSALDYDIKIINDNNGFVVPHRDILIQLRAEYLNKHTIDESERTAALSSGWEMEM